MQIKVVMVTETGLYEGLQQSSVFINMEETTKTHHEIGIQAKTPQMLGPFDTFSSQALFGLKKI